MNKDANLRQIFVQMLFALALGQVALKCGEIINLNGAKNLIGSIQQYHYIYSHLLLCMVILTTSWVGWQLSQSVGNTGRISSIFSLQFIILLLDIFLVVSYFVIVRGAEIDFGNHTTRPSNLFPEATWSMFIFIIYIAWDFVTKGITIAYKKREDGTFKRSRRLTLMPFLQRTWQTSLCLAFIIYINYATDPKSDLEVTILDLSLVMVFLIFRGWKQEIKRTYHIQKDQIPRAVEIISDISENTDFPISVSDGKYKISFFIVKILPFLLFIITLIIYYKL